jgi:hypothetical protein
MEEDRKRFLFFCFIFFLMRKYAFLFLFLTSLPVALFLQDPFYWIFAFLMLGFFIYFAYKDYKIESVLKKVIEDFSKKNGLILKKGVFSYRAEEIVNDRKVLVGFGFDRGLRYRKYYYIFIKIFNLSSNSLERLEDLDISEIDSSWAQSGSAAKQVEFADKLKMPLLLAKEKEKYIEVGRDYIKVKLFNTDSERLSAAYKALLKKAFIL